MLANEISSLTVTVDDSTFTTNELLEDSGYEGGGLIHITHSAGSFSTGVTLTRLTVDGLTAQNKEGAVVYFYDSSTEDT